MIEPAILENVARKCRPTVVLAELFHLTSVAKAIEHVRYCQIFMEGFESDSRVPKSKCFTATVEPFFAFKPKDGSELTFVQHFIFYRRDKDPDVERFRVAHELGHCALHWPLDDRISRRIFGNIPEIGQCYIVNFDEKEEQEADAFACLLRVHRPKPVRSVTLEVNTNVQNIVEEYAKRGILQSVGPTS